MLAMLFLALILLIWLHIIAFCCSATIIPCAHCKVSTFLPSCLLMLRLFFLYHQVSDLRAELDRRSLSTAGLKADLLARLSDALEEEDRAAREEEEEKAKGATEAGGGDDEFEDCLPDDGDAEDQITSGSVGSSKSTSNLSVGTAEANLVAAQAAASAAAQAAATWVSKRGSTSSGLRLTAGASPSSSSVVGHEFPWLLRGGFACRALLHLATSEADGEEGLTSGSGASSAAVAGTLAAEARATVHRFEACVDALSTASTEVNSSSGSSNSNGGAASEEATHEVSHLLAPSNLPSACSSDRLEGAVLALERFLSVNWPNVMSSSSSSAAVASAHAAATGVPALQGLLQLHLLLDHALAAALTAAAAAAGSTAGGTAKDSSGSSGLSTSTLSNACSFLEDCASMVSLLLFACVWFWVACSGLEHFEIKKTTRTFLPRASLKFDSLH